MTDFQEKYKEIACILDDIKKKHNELRVLLRDAKEHKVLTQEYYPVFHYMYGELYVKVSKILEVLV